MTTSELNIKEGMMELWKRTFHDSPEYVKLIFDNYFNTGIPVYRCDGNKVVASLLGIPYEFKCKESTSKGLYLCGISTDPAYRRKGLMSELLNEIESKALTEGYDFLFLIPSGETNRMIYQGKGFIDGIYKCYEYYTSVHDFTTEFQSTLFCFDERVRKLKMDLYDSLVVNTLKLNPEKKESIIQFISDNEKLKNNYLNLCHTEKDLKIAIEDNHIYGGQIFYSENKNGDLTAVMFACGSDDGRIKVYAQYCEDPCSYFRLLKEIKDYFAEMSLTVMRIPEEVKGKGIWSEASVVANPDGPDLESLVGIETRVYYSSDNSKVYGMIKVLNLDNVVKDLCNIETDLSFKLIVNDYEKNERFFIEVGKRKCTVEKIDRETENNKRFQGLTALSIQDFLYILFRKKVRDDIITEAFGIPRLPVGVSLMLD